MSPEDVKTDVRFLLQELDRELKEMDSLFRLAKVGDFDRIHTMAASVVLQSVYNGLESIFIKLYQFEKGRFIAESNWHRKLLDLVGGTTPDSIRIISEESLDKLSDYLAFRHMFRHNYSWKLDPDLVKSKLLEIPTLQEKVKEEILSYLSTLP